MSETNPQPPADDASSEMLDALDDPGRPHVPMGLSCAPPQVVRGFVMGSADIVPGVSGGTVALALGIYRTLIAALDRCVDVVAAALRFDGSGVVTALKRVPWIWIISLLVGILGAIFLLADILETALRQNPLELAGLFMGLIAGACVLCWKQIEQVSLPALVLVVVWAVGFFVFLGITPTAQAGGPAPPLWVFFVTGAIAICAMVLPGVSGSFLLVVMGVYYHVLAAVTNRDVLTLGVFALGCIVGISLAARSLSWLLTKYHDLVVASMIGLMIGSVRILWPWPNGLESTSLQLPTADTWLVPTALGILGLVLVLGLDAMAQRRAAARGA